MKFNFNWGHGITVFYILFVATLVFVLISSRRVNHNLVVDDYYAKDLRYQEQYQKMSNSMALDEALQISFDRKQQKVILKFDLNSKVSEGLISFYRPSDKSADFNQKIEGLNNGEMTISTHTMLPGKWKIMVDWNQDGKSFYKELEIRV